MNFLAFAIDHAITGQQAMDHNLPIPIQDDSGELHRAVNTIYQNGAVSDILNFKNISELPNL